MTPNKQQADRFLPSAGTNLEQDQAQMEEFNDEQRSRNSRVKELTCQVQDKTAALLYLDRN